MKKKYIKTSKGYFNFINENKNKIEVLKVRLTKKYVIVEYVDR